MGELANRAEKALTIPGARLYPGHDTLVRAIAELEQEVARLHVPPISVPTINIVGDPLETATFATAAPESRAERIRKRLVQANGGGNWRQLANELAAREIAGESYEWTAQDEQRDARPPVRVLSMDSNPQRIAAAADEEARANRAAFTIAAEIVARGGRVLQLFAVPSAGFTAGGDVGGCEFHVVNHAGKNLVVAFIDTGGSPNVDLLERRGVELIEAGEKLLVEYEKQKASTPLPLPDDPLSGCSPHCTGCMHCRDKRDRDAVAMRVRG